MCLCLSASTSNYSGHRHKPMRIDATISLGNVLTVVVILIGLFGATADLRERITAIEVKIDPLWIEFSGKHNRE